MKKAFSILIFILSVFFLTGCSVETVTCGPGTIPHVTNHDEADITEMESFRSSLTDMYTGEKIKITPLAFIIKALVASLKKFPSFNSSIDEIETGKMTLKKYYHIGIAVDTPNGLMVPKIRNANNKKISLISKELKEVSELCRNLKIDKKELFGGSMTITSLEVEEIQFSSIHWILDA